MPTGINSGAADRGARHVDIQSYVNEIRELYKSGQTTESSFRPVLSDLFRSVDPTLTVINEPKKLIDVGAPDFVFVRNGISIGWCEAKDIGKDVRKFATGDYSKEQKSRYTKGLPNLVYTNGLDFEFIRGGEAYAFVTIAGVEDGITERPDNFAVLERLLKDFAAQTPVSITTAKQLAEMMAGKAAIIKDIMGRALQADLDAKKSTELTDQYEGFQASLIHDISVSEFADIYAETIAYGLFAARLHDTTHGTFSRSEALELLPKSNPFLRNLFVYIAGPLLDDRLIRMIDDLCDIFKATDLHDLLKDFGKFTARTDPFIHFYETFLGEYNPAKKKARGVWYTPEPVVNFIVRAVDDVLKTEFGLADGLADTSKVTVDWDTGQTDNRGKPVLIKKDVHRVQVLDPATGTGTFLAEVIKLVAGRVQGMAPGQWSGYVEKDLIPRLHGFELLMASYAMCHMKLDMMLTEMGYKPSGTPPRLSVYLTNSLEEGERVEQTLQFARWVSDEAKGANAIKRDHPIMCVIGNPPYSGESSNTGPWIMDLIKPYKMEPGGKQKLQERNPKWINDDYVKFIRFAEHMIAKNGEGVLGFITNHGYLDNPTFRGMRWHLMNTFDKIYVLDLHGNSKKKEVAPDGSADKNVFDIMQGVAIIIGVKRKGNGAKPKPLAQVHHSELWGSREIKGTALWEGTLTELPKATAQGSEPHFLFVRRDSRLESSYNSGFAVNSAFLVGVMGFQTHRDEFAIGWVKDEVIERCRDLANPDIPDSNLRERYRLADNRDWQLAVARRAIQANSAWNDGIAACHYRPLDNRFCHLSYVTMDYPRGEMIQHAVKRNNMWLGVGRQGLAIGTTDWCLATVSDCAMDANVFRRGGVNATPLYLYPADGTLDTTIRLNFEPKLYAQIRAAAGLTGPLIPPDGTDSFRKATGDARPDEVKVFDYIYGVLHSPAYRETYAEFLKIDFPRVPFPRDPETFKAVSEKGEALRRLHLMEDAAIGDTPFPFEGDGDSVVDKPNLENGKVWINATQGFAGVSQTAWDFHIGGYQPAQKWLKDRKGRALGWDDIRHYQKIIKILGETHRLMGEIELPLD
ncbi:DNA methyltransferase [Chakrabartia godavariana]|nr:DNA methyltransferase [Chakrabartia godavariana]